jgi:hypothetical protein
MNGLALWLDASNIDGDNNSSLSDGDAVMVWKDLSGNDIDIDKNDSGNLPKLINEQNKNFVAFNQNGDNNEHLYSSKTFEGLKNQNKFSIYIVQKLDSLAETDMDTISIIYGNADIIAFENNSWVEGGYRFQTCIPGKCSDVRSGNGNLNINLITLQKDSSNLKIFVNGQLQDNHNEVFENTDTSTADLKIILSGLKFNNGGLNDRNLIGRIGEIIIVAGEVSNENNLKINNYLSNKWNLTATVDSDGDGLMDADDPEPTVKRDTTIMAVGYNGEILTSIDGENWTSRSSGTSINLLDVAFGNNNFVAVGYSGTILHSSDGISWSPKNSGTTKRLYGVTYGNNTFVAVGESGTLLSSEDGSYWTSRTSGITQYILQATYGNGIFVVVGNSGKILTSTDGISWTSTTSGTTSHLQGVTYEAGKFIAVGQSGRIITSTNGISWTLRTSGISTYLFGVTYGNNNYVTVGASGKILTSQDGTSWTTRTSGTTNSFIGINFVEDLFIAVGESGIIFTSPDGRDWTSQDSGTSEYIRRLTND